MPRSLYLAAGAVCCALFLSLAASPVAADDQPVYELRTYTTNEGKMAALHQRFRNHTMAIFEKHGMRNVAYWQSADDPNVLIYVVEHKSRAAADENWQAFVSDPEWQQVYAASIADGRLVAKIDRVFMSRTDFSP